MLIKEDGEYNEPVLEELILDMVRKGKLKTVKELAQYLEKTYDIPTRDTIHLLTRMKEMGRITLHKKSVLEAHEPTQITPEPQTLLGYLQSPQATGFWVTLASTFAAIVVALLIPEDLYPLVIIRWVLGALFVLLLPGYALTTAIFPQKELDSIERIAVSFGLSLAVSPLVGLLLNFTPGGIALTHVLICLALITGISMAFGAYRKAKTITTNG